MNRYKRKKQKKVVFKLNLKEFSFKKLLHGIINFFKTLPARTKAWGEKQLLKLGEKMGTGEALDATWKVVRPISIYVISLILVICIVAGGFGYANRMLFAPVSIFNKDPIVFEVSTGSSMATVASNLKKNGLIRSTWGIKLMADFTNLSSKVKAGEYILDRTMSAQQLLEIITRPTQTTSTVRITLVEGLTVKDMAQLLQDKGVITSADSFLSEVKTGTNYSSFYFVPPLNDIKNTKYSLEGYLFPDTYEFYAGSTNNTVITRLLERFSEVYLPQYTARAEQLGLTMNQVITLASLIEKEGRGEDFPKISAVFHNRLAQNMKLESDVTVQYALGVKRLVLTADELKVDSPYNTYTNVGLPPGPICNPSKAAIIAALYPDQDILNGGYLYFTLTDPYTGEVQFSKTLAEQTAIKNQYKDAWAKYDKEKGN